MRMESPLNQRLRWSPPDVVYTPIDVTSYDFPKEHWGHLRTTNPVESPFAALRLRTDAAKRYKRVDRAIAVIWKMLMVAEQRFRRLKAPELIEDVYLGAQYADGIAIESTAEMVAA